MKQESHRFFKHKEYSKESIKAAKTTIAPTIAFCKKQEQEILAFLDKNDFLTASETYIKATGETKEMAKSLLANSFNLLKAKVKAFADICLPKKEEYPTPYMLEKDESTTDPKEPSTRIFKCLSNIFEEFKSNNPSQFVVLENYSKLKLEISCAIANLKLEQLEWALNHYASITSDEKNTSRKSSCSIS